MRSASATTLTVWLAWVLLVVTHYFTIPDEELLRVIDGPLHGFPYWREAAAEGLRAVGGATMVVLAAWGAGTLATYPLRRIFATPGERVLVVLAAGLAALGAGFFLLAILQVYRPPVVLAVLILLGAGGVIALVSGGLPRRFVPDLRILPWQDSVFAFCAAAAVGFSLIGALAVESESDALWYHLWLPARWLEAGRPVDVVDEFISLYPLGWDLVGGAAMVAGGPVAAKLLHWLCLPLLGTSTFLLTRHLVPGASAMLAAALAVVTPITIWEATTAYLDLALAFYVSLSIYALARYDSSRDRKWLVVSALLMSAALAVKHLGLVALAILTGVLGAREIHRSGRIRQALGVTALFIGISLTLPMPWYVRAYLASGNPVFPDMYRVFGATPSERWSPDNERGLQGFKDRFGTTRTSGNLARLPWNATVHAASFGGTLGPLFLILVPAALIGRGVRRTALLLAAGCTAYIAIWASPISSFQMRFLIPIVPLLAVLGAEGAARVLRAAQAVGPVVPNLVFSALVVLLLFNLPPTSEWHEPDRQGWSGWMTHIVRGLPAPVVLGAESRQDYLTRKVPSYAAWEYINATLPPAVKILTFSGEDHLYSHRPRLSNTAPVANTATWGTPAGEECTALAAVRGLGVTHVLFDKRQLDDGSVRALAIGSDAMLACCLLLEWEDQRLALYRVRDAGGGAAESSADDTARHACGT